MRCFASVMLLALLAGAPAHAQPSGSESQRLLLESGTPAGLRANLLEHARRVEAQDKQAAGEAYYFAGRSYDRAGKRDSAITCYRLALERRPGHRERLALTDALLARRGNGDVATALELLSAADPNPASFELQTEREALLAWALHLSGRSKEALAAFKGVENLIGRESQWRYRMAVVELAGGDPRRAYRWLFPLAVASRKQDDDVMARLGEIADMMNFASRLEREIDQSIAERDRIDQLALEKIGGRRLKFGAWDGFPLSGAVIPPAAKGPHPGAVVLVAPGDTVADYDSLSMALTRAGYSVMLLDVRGSGSSVAPNCPLPDRWARQEQALQTLSARDARRALETLRKAAPTDTARALLVGVGVTASIAVEAAEQDREITALLLVSPRPSPVERGPMRARLARLQIPVYFQSGPEDFDWASLTEAFYQSGNRGASRIAEARLVGHGVRQFYYDPEIATRFTRWLDETMRNAKPRDPRPSSPRKG